MQSASMPRRYLALWFPWFPCDRTRRAMPQEQCTPSTPLALVMRTRNAFRLSAVDVAASRLGLTVGMTLADARARCPDLATLPHDAQADMRELDRLAAQMLGFTPMVSADPPDGLMLDITACAHLFGGETVLARQAMMQAGYTVRHAFADHAATARALARYEAPASFSLEAEELARVRALPVAALELPEEVLSGLRRAGLVSLGDLAARPMAALAARFGEEMVARLLAVLGRRNSPMTPLRLSAPLRAEARFAEPIGRTEYVLDVIEDLLIEVFRQMEARHLGGRRFAVQLERADGVKRRLVVETSLPSREPARVMRLFRERIESLVDPLDPGFGFDAVVLAVTRTECLPPSQIASRIAGIKVQAEEDGIAALIDRLATRLGPDKVLRLTSCDTHVPEAAQTFLPAARPASQTWPDPTLKPPRPLFLFDPPQPITAIASVPDGPPQRLRWRGRLHEVALAEGPERLAPAWWSLPEGHLPGGAGLARDYYRIEDEAGSRYWVFRLGQFGEIESPRWYMHGLFA